MLPIRNAAQAVEDSGESSHLRDDLIAVYERLATAAVRPTRGPTMAAEAGGAAG